MFNYVICLVGLNILIESIKMSLSPDILDDFSRCTSQHIDQDDL